ncbi:uncharacterized protein LOC115532473 [Gadus morhua]|uniref:uncharacterized protein LOC115532473 n=1 Tax=Gadus morhua TaxID=8049 RepID=UPI0011B52836|nr:uncharacterized protein LOC115532473 [Gadus morhua]
MTMVYSTKLTLVMLAFRSSVMLTSGAGIPEVVTNLGDTDTEVFTREGEDAILPCGLGSPVNLKDEVVDWKKKQQEVFFYEKGKHYNNGKRGQDPQFGGRVHLLPGGLQAGDASVILSSATQADGGVYSCFFPPLGPTRLIRLTVERVPDDTPPKIRKAGHWLTGDHEEVLGNGPWKAIDVSFIVLFILSFGVNIYQFTKTNNCRKGHGQQAVPDSDSSD